MIIITPEKILNFKNSANDGRVFCALLPEKWLKLLPNLIIILTLAETTAPFYICFIMSLAPYNFTNITPHKTISIATS